MILKLLNYDTTQDPRQETEVGAMVWDFWCIWQKQPRPGNEIAGSQGHSMCDLKTKITDFLGSAPCIQPSNDCYPAWRKPQISHFNNCIWKLHNDSLNVRLSWFTYSFFLVTMLTKNMDSCKELKCHLFEMTRTLYDSLAYRNLSYHFKSLPIQISVSNVYIV